MFTMNEIQDEFDKIYSQMLKNGSIPIPEGITLSKKFLGGVHTLGQCQRKHRHNADGWYFEYTIHLNRAFLASDKISEKTLRSVLVHEFVHTLPYCWNHGPEFHEWGSYIGPIFGVDVSTHAEGSEKKEFDEAQFSRAKAIAICLDCGALYKYYRRTKQMWQWGPGKGPHFVCGCKHGDGNPKFRLNCLILRDEGRDIISADWCHQSYKKKAQEWLERHVPPKALTGQEPFHWSLEAINKEYWWKEGETAVAAETLPKQSAHSVRPKEKKSKPEQLSLF